MATFVGIAGIPAALFDPIRAAPQHKLVGDVDALEKFRAVRDGNGRECYTDRSVLEVRSWIGRMFETTVRPHVSDDVNVIVIYIQQPGGDDFASSISPWALTRRIALPKLHPGPRAAVIRRAANTLTQSINGSMPILRKTAAAVSRELAAGRNRTPILLPMRNFSSPSWQEGFMRLATELGNHGDAENRLLTFRKSIARDYWRRIGSTGRSHFVDDRGVVFQTPAASHYHAIAHLNDGSHTDCFLRGNLRMGSRYPASFHFDCRFEMGGDFLGVLPSCHGQPVGVDGRPYLNIAPNDHIRSAGIK